MRKPTKRKKKGDIPIQTVKLPSKVLIGGSYWKLLPLDDEAKKFLKGIGLSVPNALGTTVPFLKRIYVDGKHHPEELLNTLLHEVLHAITYERSHQKVYADLCVDEEAIFNLTADILTCLKQMAEVRLRFEDNPKKNGRKV